MDHLATSFTQLSQQIDGHTLEQLQRVKDLLFLPVSVAGRILDLCSYCCTLSEDGEAEGLLTDLVSSVSGLLRKFPQEAQEHLVLVFPPLLKLLTQGYRGETELEGKEDTYFPTPRRTCQLSCSSPCAFIMCNVLPFFRVRRKRLV